MSVILFAPDTRNHRSMATVGICYIPKWYDC
nr:MAG TPA: hypothetical protein [Caudoviricetes sp.]